MVLAVTATCAIAALTDLVWGRIFNWLTLPAFLLGVGASAWSGGWLGAGQAVLGAAVGLVLYGWMFWLRIMGGGDIKLLMALGAWGGPRYALHLALFSLFLGGAMALVHLAAKGRIRDFARRIHVFLLSVLVKELEPQAPELDRKLTMPFGIPISIAGIWLLHANPLGNWLGGL
jgi:prepilin peptidase CpaA